MKITKNFFDFNNTYIELPGKFYQKIKPEPVKKPKLIKLNHQLTNFLNLKISSLKNYSGISILSGNQVPENTVPIAMAYAGHQFGNFVEQLGDGRAVLLGELIAKNGLRYDLQLKGSGKTSFSRLGDGRSPLGPVIREYIISEAMHYLGIPTTRSLSIISTGEFVEREKIEPGGILARVSASHIRVGTFEFFYSKNDFASLKKLADYTINRHYPEIINSKNKYRLLLEKTIDVQAKLVALWMNHGFIHGVMNTDNTTISGETIDYGPCAFMNNYDPLTVYSYIDINGRYSYGNQPKIMLWNLSIFAEAVWKLLHEEKKEAHQIILDCLKVYPILFEKYWIEGIKKKLGFTLSFSEDKKIIELLLEIMFKQKSDFTLTFRRLSETLDLNKNHFISMFKNEKPILNWYNIWKKRLEKENNSKKKIFKEMTNTNPLFIPRNHIVDRAIKEATEKQSFSLMNDLLEVLQKPFDKNEKKIDLSRPPELSEDIKNTFCGT